MKPIHKYILLIFIFLLANTPSFCQAGGAEELADKGFASLQNKDYEKAIDYCSQALSLSPKNFHALNVRGLAYISNKNYSLAAADFTKAIQIQPDSIKLYLNRGIAYYQNKQYDFAVADFTKSTGAEAGNANAFDWLQHAYDAKAQSDVANEDYLSAITYFNKAISINNTDAVAYSGTAHSYYMEDNYDQALEYYNKLLDNTPGNTLAYYGAGLASFRNGNYEQAISFFKKAIDIDNSNGSALISLIAALICERKFDEASSYYSDYLTRKPKSAFESNDSKFYLIYIDAAIKQASTNDYTAALKSIGDAERQYNNYNLKTKPANSLKNRYVDMLAFKGYLFEKLNRFYEAKNTYQQALTLNKNQPEIVDALARLNNPPAALDKIPPVITLISPVDTRSLSVVDEKEETTTGSFSIVDQNQRTEIVGKAVDASGISSVKINGQPASSVEEGGIFIGYINLQNGTNTITIEATDKSNNVASKTFNLPASLMAKSSQPKPQTLSITADQKQHYYAIIIGEQDYKDLSINKLEHPVEDARAFASILQNRYTFDNVDTLFDRSREDILDAIYNKCNSMDENDNLLIFYAGHGTVYPAGTTSGYLVPVTAKLHSVSTYIAVSSITDALKNSHAKHVLFVADACYSGSLLRDLPPETPPGILELYNKRSRTAMTSGNLETVPDNSPFIHFIEQRLKDNTKDYFCAKDLFDDLKTAITNNSDTHPQYGVVANVGDEGGDFVFIKKQ